MSQPPLTSPQLTQIQSHYESQLQQIVSGMNLRRWLVEKWLGTDHSIEDLERLHAFITHASTSGLNPPKESQ